MLWFTCFHGYVSAYGNEFFTNILNDIVEIQNKIERKV